MPTSSSWGSIQFPWIRLDLVPWCPWPLVPWCPWPLLPWCPWPLRGGVLNIAWGGWWWCHSRYSWNQKDEFSRKQLQFQCSQAKGDFWPDLAWISVLVCVTPLLQPPCKMLMSPSWCSGWPHLRLGWAQALLSHFSFLFWYSKDFAEINRDHFTPFILWQIHIAEHCCFQNVWVAEKQGINS